MPVIQVFALSLVLGTDAFSMAVGLGTKGLGQRENVTLILLVGFFHILMPVIGIYAGRILGTLFNEYATYAGALILIILGAHMLYDHLSPRAASGLLELEGSGLVFLALGVSMDALSVGLSLGIWGAQLYLAALIIGVTALVMTGMGIVLGNEFGQRIGEYSELVGGIVLLFLGINTLLG